MINIQLIPYLKKGLVPYINIAEANDLIPNTERYIGLTVNIREIEYHYEKGIKDINLVIKNK